jgi:hypothetical protein
MFEMTASMLMANEGKLKISERVLKWKRLLRIKRKNIREWLRRRKTVLKFMLCSTLWLLEQVKP